MAIDHSHIRETADAHGESYADDWAIVSYPRMKILGRGYDSRESAQSALQSMHEAPEGQRPSVFNDDRAEVKVELM